MSGGSVITDAVTAIGLCIAFHYGLTGFACAWHYRKTLLSSRRDLWMRGILPVLGGLITYFAGGWMRFVSPAFFEKETLTRATATLVPDLD